MVWSLRLCYQNLNAMKTIALLFTAAAITGIVTTGSVEKQNAQLANLNVANIILADVDHHECDHMNGYAYNDDIIDLLTGRKVSTTLGDAVYDRKMREEVQNQRDFFQGVPAEVVILDEQHRLLRNAYASQAGKIYMGKYMFYHTVKNYNELAVAGILAHEWGHRVQYTFGFDKELGTMELELEADAMSGYYMALNKGCEWNHIEGYFQSTFSTGDFAVESPQHHGTPNQRVAAAYLGMQLAKEAVETGHAFTYEELHERMVDSIQINISQKRDGMPIVGSKIREIAEGKISGKDIAAPVLSASERSKYFPKEEE